MTKRRIAAQVGGECGHACWRDALAVFDVERGQRSGLAQCGTQRLKCLGNDVLVRDLQTGQRATRTDRARQLAHIVNARLRGLEFEMRDFSTVVQQSSEGAVVCGAESRAGKAKLRHVRACATGRRHLH